MKKCVQSCWVKDDEVVEMRVSIKPQMERQLKQLGRKNPQLIREFLDVHIPKIAQSPQVVGKHLKGKLRCVWRYAFGHHPEYRILYTIEDDELQILDMDTRENIYG